MTAKTIQIYSRDNHFQRLEVLKRNREKRSKYRQFIVEGVRPINQALAHGWAPNQIVFSSKSKLSSWAEDILGTNQNSTQIACDKELFSELSDKDEPSELLMIFDFADDNLERIETHSKMLIVVFDRPGSPGNLGSSIRSCDALGADGIIITGHAVDVYDPLVVRASRGSFFSKPIVRLASDKEFFSWIDDLKKIYAELRVVGATEDGQESLERFHFDREVVLVMGNETVGLSRSYLDKCDSTVKIPMVGTASSLNVSCACSIVLYEIARQKS
jgi:tRNA G18 (ribose-2'-O)-methylase SpoU